MIEILDPEYENLIKEMQANSMRVFIGFSIIILLAVVAGRLLAMAFLSIMSV